ncbi:autophagy-related protein 101 [Striga asiatica]|uniref:Autophagy-related protein 101 n=1 Tax=Striga asiatica TaxID=4170 RepID=A0A5A7PDJ0_STRAF|nr:autophagy-related protein 101 [Striga asiatica]
MSCEDVEHSQIRDILRCILHTILFHRALGLVRPKHIDLELFDITYVGALQFHKVLVDWVFSEIPAVQCGDVELERKIDEKIDQFIDRVEKHPNKKNQGHSLLNLFHMCLSFYEVKNKQATWFTNKVERLYLELCLSDSAFGMDMFKRMLQTGHPTMLS